MIKNAELLFLTIHASVDQNSASTFKKARICA